MTLKKEIYQKIISLCGRNEGKIGSMFKGKVSLRRIVFKEIFRPLIFIKIFLIFSVKKKKTIDRYIYFKICMLKMK